MLPIDTAMPAEAQESTDFKAVAAAFPHLRDKLVFFWGDPEFDKLMDELQQNWRNEQRAGVPRDILLALEGLVSAHDVAYPKPVHKRTDLWKLSKAC